MDLRAKTLMCDETAWDLLSTLPQRAEGKEPGPPAAPGITHDIPSSHAPPAPSTAQNVVHAAPTSCTPEKPALSPTQKFESDFVPQARRLRFPNSESRLFGT